MRTREVQKLLRHPCADQMGTLVLLIRRAAARRAGTRSTGRTSRPAKPCPVHSLPSCAALQLSNVASCRQSQGPARPGPSARSPHERLDLHRLRPQPVRVHGQVRQPGPALHAFGPLRWRARAGQLAVLARRSPGYEIELPLQAVHGNLRVRGRADGYEADVNRLEEIKTIRGPIELIPENRRALHWAQLETYGALIAADRGLAELELALVYVDADTQHETVLREKATAARTAGRLRGALRAVRGLGRAGGSPPQCPRCRPQCPALPLGRAAPGPAPAGRGRVPRGRQRPPPAGAGAHRHRQDAGHALPAATRDARPAARQDRLHDL